MKSIVINVLQMCKDHRAAEFFAGDAELSSAIRDEADDDECVASVLLACVKVAKTTARNVQPSICTCMGCVLSHSLIMHALLIN